MSPSERNTVAQELAVKDGQIWEELSPEMVSAYLHNADLVIEERHRRPSEVAGQPVYRCDRCKDNAYIGEKRCMECNPVGLPVEEVHPHVSDKLLVVEDTKKVGIYLTGMNLRDYMAKCLEGSIEWPKWVDSQVVVNPELPLIVIEMECGERVVYRTLDDMPEDSVPCTCGNPNHWVVLVEKGADLTEEEKAKAEEAEEAEAKAKAEQEAEEVRKTRPLKPSEYRCSKCSKPGKTVIHMLKKDGTGIGHKHKGFAVVED